MWFCRNQTISPDWQLNCIVSLQVRNSSALKRHLQGLRWQFKVGLGRLWFEGMTKLLPVNVQCWVYCVVDHLEPLTKQCGKAQRGMQRDNSQQQQCGVRNPSLVRRGHHPYIMGSNLSAVTLFKYPNCLARFLSAAAQVSSGICGETKCRTLSLSFCVKVLNVSSPFIINSFHLWPKLSNVSLAGGVSPASSASVLSSFLFFPPRHQIIMTMPLCVPDVLKISVSGTGCLSVYRDVEILGIGTSETHTYIHTHLIASVSLNPSWLTCPAYIHLSLDLSTFLRLS